MARAGRLACKRWIKGAEADVASAAAKAGWFGAKRGPTPPSAAAEKAPDAAAVERGAGATDVDDKPTAGDDAYMAELLAERTSLGRLPALLGRRPLPGIRRREKSKSEAARSKRRAEAGVAPLWRKLAAAQ
mgnify:CR=1 FL=1